MFCPNCKTEYRPGFSVCSDCGAQLVEKLADEKPTTAPRNVGPELLWTGTDSAAYGVILNALDDAGIPHHESQREVGPIPGLAQPVHAIFIPSSERDTAHIEMEKALRELENGPRQPNEDLSGSAFGSDSELEEADDTEPADDIVEDYDPGNATVQIWSGSDLDLKNMLVASFRENGIGCEVAVNGAFRILVMPSDESRAREIVREVIDASPPL